MNRKLHQWQELSLTATDTEQENVNRRGSSRGRGHGRGGDPHEQNRYGNSSNRDRGRRRGGITRGFIHRDGAPSGSNPFYSCMQEAHSGRNNKTHRNSADRGYRPDSYKKRFGFKYVQRLLENEDVEQVIMVLSKDKNGFVELMCDDLSNDLVVLIVKLLRKLCSCSFRNLVVDLMGATLKSKFVDHLLLYIIQIINQDSRAKQFNKLFWQNPNELWDNLLHVSKITLDIMPSVSCGYVEKILQTMSLCFPSIEEHAPVSDDVKAKTADLLAHVKHIIKGSEVKKVVPEKRVKLGNEEPPNDFREIPIIPSSAEVISRESPFLRRNIVDGPYDSIDQYLDIQFRLLREDFVTPLRNGICAYMENQFKPRDQKRRLENIRVYQKVKFVNIEIQNEYNCYKLQFNSGNIKFENSRRFMFGSLVCFTNDNFATLLFGVIVNRDVKFLQKGELVVGFRDEVHIDYDTDYLMIESSVYFEPYYQVLGVLQTMRVEYFPMEKYIIDVTTDTSPPQYLLKKNPVFYNIEGQNLCPLNIPKEFNFNHLNDSQRVAFEAALSREFCIIQGPPGTGKTYLGLKVAHTLLRNFTAWYHKTPMLVICFTNHALDQFLEGLLPLTDKILRVGGQSKNENLNPFNIRSRRSKTSNPAFLKKRGELKTILQRVKSVSDDLTNINSNDCVMSISAIGTVIKGYEHSWFHLAEPHDIQTWLLVGRSNSQIRRGAKEAETATLEINADVMMVDENDGNVGDTDNLINEVEVESEKPMICLNELRKKIGDLQNKITKLDKDGSKCLLERERVFNEMQESIYILQYVEWRLNVFGQDPLNRRQPEHLDLQHPENMHSDHRWQLYFYWLDIYTNFLMNKYYTLGTQYQEIYLVYNELREVEDTQLMKEHLVVGMTTTGAARLQSSLQTLRSPIVIVEEAAEILEAHIVAALTSSCQHLILIGDHLQLKPSAANFKIEKHYGLGISLFERMVYNRIQCYTLNVQHRMRPEISSLIKPAIYRDLQDHKSTLHRPPVLGLQKPLFFINHKQEEQACQDESKKNLHEAQFLIALARHLILNGYEPGQITILAAYLGQMYEMMRERRMTINSMLLQDVRIAVLDNYQGEESDIVLLSLVRNNAENKIGFLAIQNRVCVALSRARIGLYIMGNMEMLCAAPSENDIWKQVKSTLEDQNAIGSQLPLKCQIHPDKITQVSLYDDFLRLAEGGCDTLCETLLSCGHICKKLCHVGDRDHNSYRCREKCTKELCNDPSHICKKLCHEECGPCCYPVERSFDCGHVMTLDCSIDPNNYKCPVLVFTELPCKHSAQKPCSIDSNEFQCPHPCDTRVEPCGHACMRRCHIRVDPDHLQYTCREQCTKPRSRCRESSDSHICPNLCYEECDDCDVKMKRFRSCGHVFEIACRLDVEIDVTCTKPCKKRLACSHPCRSKCFQDCELCNHLVKKVIPECGHTVKLACSEEPARLHCKERRCPRLLPCGHQCKKKCSAPCTLKCMEIVDCSIDSPCGHIVNRIQCHWRETRDPEILLARCSEPCSTVLKCKHKCSGSCGECLQGRIHAKCREKCGAILVCNHECQTACREACRPCTRPCEMKCKHSKCKKKCGEPCTPCSNNCPRRCIHQFCKNRCGQICSVPPCTKECGKKLKCGHQCVGFCNDPCPRLCRICDKDELTEIFLGNEDEEDAIYVMLNECGHIFENGDMELWLTADNNEIKLKVCPRCKTNITTTERYSDYTKQAMQDVTKVKKKAYGDLAANNAARMQLLEKVLLMKEKYSFVLGLRDFGLSVFHLIKDRLQPTKSQRRQPINAMELSSIECKLQILDEIFECCQDLPSCLITDTTFKNQLSLLEPALSRDENHISDQEKEDLDWEITRLERMVQLAKIKSKTILVAQIPARTLAEKITTELSSKERYLPSRDAEIKKLLEELSSIKLSDRERKEIVNAMGMTKGHWFRCPQGHIYAIGECGGAMEVSKCNECGESIGGTQHRLLAGQTFAGDFDDAAAPAWPGVVRPARP